MIQPIPTDRAAWLKMRQPYIGGSDIATLFHTQAGFGASLFNLWHQKAGHIEGENLDDVERIEWGRAMEPLIGAFAAKRHGWTIEAGGFAVDETTIGLAATLDFQITAHDEAEFSGPGCLETKNVDGIMWKSDNWDLRPPLYIELQLQHQMAATGWSWGCIAACVGGNTLQTWKRKARPVLIAEIRARVRAFWASIENSAPPNVDATDSTADALKALYQVQKDRAVEIPPDLAGPLHEVVTLLAVEREAAKGSDSRQQAARNFIKQVLAGGGRAQVVSPDPSSPSFWISQDARGTIRIKEYAPT